MNRVTRSEKMLEQAAAKLGMTECGKNWLTIALDPFHDTPVRVDGYVDQTDSPSIVQVIKQTVTITAPAGIVTSTANWDCHVMNFPWLPANFNQAADVYMAASQPGVIAGNPLPPGIPQNNYIFQFSPPAIKAVADSLTVYAGPAGASLDPFSFGTNAPANTSYSDTQIRVPLNYQNGEYRVIASGFEIHNTTAELYKQGSLVCYRNSCPDVSDSTTYNYVQVLSGPEYSASAASDTFITSPPPQNTAAALLLPNSKQWNASEGAYLVSPFHSDILSTSDSSRYALYMPNNTLTSEYGMASTILSQNMSVNGVTVNYPCPNNYYVFNADQTGVFLTGLSYQTSLVINYNIIIERFPTQLQTDLVVLADPSPRYDPIAIEMYSHIVRQLPVGVPVKMNGLGDWFSSAISKVADFVAPVLSAIPHPIAQGVGMGLKGLNAVVNGPPAQGAAAAPSPYINTDAPVEVIERELAPQQSYSERVPRQMRVRQAPPKKKKSVVSRMFSKLQVSKPKKKTLVKRLLRR